MEEFKQFLSNLKFTYGTSNEKVAFLDLSVSLKNGKMFTDLHTKNTD